MCFSGRESKTTQIYLLIDGLDFYPRVLLGDDRQLDPDVATLPSPKEALLSNSLFTLNYFGHHLLFYLINHGKCGAICAVPLNYYNETPQHGGYYLMCLSDKSLLINANKSYLL